MAVWSTVSFSALTDDRRIDAEHYRPECLAQAKRIAALPHKLLSEIADISDGNHISIAESFTEDGVRYLRGQDLADFFIADKTPVFIPESTYETLKRSHMRPGDILLGIVATIGTVSLVTDRFGKLTGNCKLGIIRPKKIESEFLATFFLSALGQREIHRWARGTVQTGVILPDLKKLPIPIISEPIRRSIAERVRAAHSRRQECERLLAQAEAMLNDALGLDRIDLTPQLFREDSLAHVSTANRLDAEFVCLPDLAYSWKPPFPLKPLGDPTVSKHVRNGLTPAASDYGDEGRPIIKVRDITEHGVAEHGGARVRPGAKAYGSHKGAIRPGDVLVLAAAHHVRYIGKAGLLPSWPTRENACQAVGELLLVRVSDAILPEVLTCYLNLLPIRLQTQRFVRGMSAHLYPTDFETLPIPILPPGLQDSVRKSFTQALAARGESSRLLDTAKRAVEIAIEENEAVALRFLEEARK